MEEDAGVRKIPSRRAPSGFTSVVAVFLKCLRCVHCMLTGDRGGRGARGGENSRHQAPDGAVRQPVQGSRTHCSKQGLCFAAATLMECSCIVACAHAPAKQPEH